MDLKEAREILSGKLEFGNAWQIEALRYLSCEEVIPELIREHSKTCRKNLDYAGCPLRNECKHYYIVTETSTIQVLQGKQKEIDSDEEFEYRCCAECPINKECPNPKSCANRIRAKYARSGLAKGA